MKLTFPRWLLLLLAALIAFCAYLWHLKCEETKINARKNCIEQPPSDFSGTWIVYRKETYKKWIEAEYKNGQKNGIEMRWYADSGDKMSKHTFRAGVLDGPYVKWNNYSSEEVLVKGEYKNGQPWDGVFLEDYGLNLVLSLDTEESNELYPVRDYVNGELVGRRRIP